MWDKEKFEQFVDEYRVAALFFAGMISWWANIVLNGTEKQLMIITYVMGNLRVPPPEFLLLFPQW